MYDQIGEDTLFMMLYAVVAVLNLVACCYLWFRQGNAFAADVTPPIRLRRWTAVFFAANTLCHLWYLPSYFLTSSYNRMMGYFIAGLLDCMTVIPLTIVILFTMLQDRRRPLWPVAVMVAPLVAGMAWRVVSRSDALMSILCIYFLLLTIGLIVYMIRALRQYGQWLRDNYADLEHKEVWQSFVVLGNILLVYVVYLLDEGGLVFEYAMEVILVVLVGYLLWRVETLSDLSISVNDDTIDEMVTTEHEKDNALPLSIRNNIGPLLKKYCEEPQLYLQNNISITQLAQQIGTNRSYLSNYFTLQGITYNTYINGLRIQHFINLYHESVATHQPVTAQQLAHQSGFRSYSTFSAAFKQSMGMTATEWMRNNAGKKQH